MNRSRTIALAALAATVCCSLPAAAEELSNYSGAQLYQRFCAACHGADGHGDGPVASDLRVEVPDLTRIAVRRGGSFPTELIRRIIDGRAGYAAHGARSMPVWGYQFALASAASGAAEKEAQTNQLIDRLAAYLQSIQSR